jgi:hypothetical protein
MVAGVAGAKFGFSERPGARERQLQRRAENPLFGVRASVYPSEVEEARRRDQTEVRDFYETLRGLVEDAANLAPNVESDVVLGLKERLDQAYEQASGLAGDQSDARNAIRRLVSVTMKAVWVGAGADVQAHAELEQEEAAREAHFQLLDQPLVADLLNPNSPIEQTELIPTLLTESSEAVAAALCLFDTGQLELICRDARELLGRLESEGIHLAEAWDRFQQIESSLHSKPAMGLN